MRTKRHSFLFVLHNIHMCILPHKRTHVFPNVMEAIMLYINNVNLGSGSKGWPFSLSIMAHMSVKDPCTSNSSGFPVANFLWRTTQIHFMTHTSQWDTGIWMIKLLNLWCVIIYSCPGREFLVHACSSHITTTIRWGGVGWVGVVGCWVGCRGGGWGGGWGGVGWGCIWVMTLRQLTGEQNAQSFFESSIAACTDRKRLCHPHQANCLKKYNYYTWASTH